MSAHDQVAVAVVEASVPCHECCFQLTWGRRGSTICRSNVLLLLNNMQVSGRSAQWKH